jgi:hypothetical protein
MNKAYAEFKEMTYAYRETLNLAKTPHTLRGDMDEVARLREALQSIVDIDYRGNRHESHDIAKRALAPNASFTQLRNKTP